MYSNVCLDQRSMSYLSHHCALGGGASLVDNHLALMKEASALTLRTRVFGEKTLKCLPSHSQPAYPSLFFSEHQKGEAGCSAKLP